MALHDKCNKKDRQGQILHKISELVMEYDGISEGKDMEEYCINIDKLSVNLRIFVKKN